MYVCITQAGLCSLNILVTYVIESVRKRTCMGRKLLKTHFKKSFSSSLEVTRINPVAKYVS